MQKNSEFVNLFLFILKNENLELFLKKPPVNLIDYFNDKDFIINIMSQFSKEDISNHEILSDFLINKYSYLFNDFEFTKKFIINTPHFNTIQKIFILKPEFLKILQNDIPYITQLTQKLNIKNGIFKIFPNLSESVEFFKNSPNIPSMDISSFSNDLIEQNQDSLSFEDLSKILTNRPHNYKYLNEANRIKTYNFFISFLNNIQDNVDYSIQYLISEVHSFIPEMENSFIFSTILVKNRIFQYIPKKDITEQLFDHIIESMNPINFSSNSASITGYHHVSNIPGDFFKNEENTKKLFNLIITSSEQQKLFFSSFINYSITHNLLKKISNYDTFVKNNLNDLLIDNNLNNVVKRLSSDNLSNFFFENLPKFIENYNTYYNSVFLNKKLPSKNYSQNNLTKI